jgi:uncharacterized membrane protein
MDYHNGAPGPILGEQQAMVFDWRAFRERHPLLFVLIVVAKVLRTKIGLLLAIACVARDVYLHKRPFDLGQANLWVALGLALISAGVAFRIAAYGCLKKKEVLATTGVYSLCRHPLYLGSMLITYGFCCLLGDRVNYIVATTYFFVFYSLTIVWEEIRLSERYGADHQQYSKTTPLLLPLGRFHAGEYRWAQAMRKGGGLLIGLTLLLVAGVEILAKAMPKW